MDNEQFQFGQALRPESGYFGSLKDSLKRTLLTRVKGFRLDQVCVATLLFEGELELNRINNASVGCAAIWRFYKRNLKKVDLFCENCAVYRESLVI